MPADRTELRPFLSWTSVWLVLEWWPMALLAFASASLGRWWNVPQWVWHNGRETTSKSLWIGSIGAVLAIALVVVGVYLLFRFHVSHPSQGPVKDLGKLYGWSAFCSFTLALLTLIQLAVWYRDGWTPSLSPRSPGALDYRYFKSVDMRLQQVSHLIRDGKLVWPQDIPPLREPVDNSTKTTDAISSKQLINELREYILDWSEAEYARADDAVGRRASLGLLAMMVEPDPRQIDQYLQWKSLEESRLRLLIREAVARGESAKQEHESLALRWTEETVPEKKSHLANQVVAAEDRLNVQIREQLRLQGRVEVLANDRLAQIGLNRQYAWLKLPTVSRGGWLRIACTWILAIYLSVRLLSTGVLCIVSYLKLHQRVEERDVGRCAEFGWFVIAAGLWWLGMGW